MQQYILEPKRSSRPQPPAGAGPESPGPSERGTVHVACAIGVLYLGFLALFIGGYQFLAGVAAWLEALGQIADSLVVDDVTAGSPDSFPGGAAQPSAAIRLTPMAVALTGLAAVAWALRFINRTRPQALRANEICRDMFGRTENPEKVCRPEDLDRFRSEVERRHDRKVLWSLPFWFSTLWILIVHGGRIGDPTAFGISNFWLLVVTLGVYLIHRYYYWRCPLCDVILGRHSERMSCGNCGLPLTD